MRSAADTSTDRLATVVEAAEVLGITPDAVRSRLRRGTLQRSPERGPDGEVLVVLEAKHAEQGDRSSDQSSTGRPTDATVALVEALEDQVAYLRQQLEEAHRANAEHRRLLAAALERIPELEASQEASSETTESRVTASEGGQRGTGRNHQGEAEKPSWWRKFFGLEV